MNLAKLFIPISSDMKAVDEIIRTHLNSEVILIRTIGEYIINMGGKRIRPAMMLIIIRSLNCNHSTQCNIYHLLAAVVEFIHTATLLHDDVVDKSELRRGQGTVNSIFGNSASVLVGDYLYSLAFEMMVKTNSMRIMSILSKATTVIAEGEVLQLLNINNPEISQERYLKIIRYKTAKLFEATAQIGAILANASPEQEQAAADYGRHIGTAFQLIDDVLDYNGDINKLGKNIGDDIRNGKITLPLIRVMEIGSFEQQKLIYHAIKTGNVDFLAIEKAICDTNSVEYVIELAQTEIKSAKKAIDSYPNSIYKDSLIGLCTFAINRKF